MYMFTDDTACIRDLIIHVICIGVRQNVAVIFFYPSQCTSGTPKFIEYDIFHSILNVSLNAVNFFLFLLAWHKKIITCVWDMTLRYMWSVHKPLHMKLLTANWDTFLARNPYQDNHLYSFVAFAAVIVCI